MSCPIRCALEHVLEQRQAIRRELAEVVHVIWQKPCTARNGARRSCDTE